MADVDPDSRKVLLRRKILGVKIQHARNRAGLNPKEVGRALSISTDLLSEIELGQRDVTLPQLEVMALLFNIPVVYFLTDDPIEEVRWDFPTVEAMALRQRIIGVLLRQARMEAGRSPEELAEKLNVPVNQVIDYEFGKQAISLSQLEMAAEYLNISIGHFIDQGISPNHRGERATTLDEIAQFSQLPAEVRQFLLNPANLLYLNIAMRLSGLSAETLRNLAEGLLEITY